MSASRSGTAGATRTCPHCKTVILESAAVCPSCRHHLRFTADPSVETVQTITPLKVEGSIRHPADGGAWEYCVVLSIKNDKGEELTRQVVGVGAMRPDEARTFSLAVEVTPTPAKGFGKRFTRH